MASDFVKAVTHTFVNFLFAYENMREPESVLAANKSTRVNNDFMQGGQKVLSLIILD